MLSVILPLFPVGTDHVTLVDLTTEAQTVLATDGLRDLREATGILRGALSTVRAGPNLMTADDSRARLRLIEGRAALAFDRGLLLHSEMDAPRRTTDVKATETDETATKIPQIEGVAATLTLLHALYGSTTTVVKTVIRAW